MLGGKASTHQDATSLNGSDIWQFLSLAQMQFETTQSLDETFNTRDKAKTGDCLGVGWEYRDSAKINYSTFTFCPKLKSTHFCQLR